MTKEDKGLEDIFGIAEEKTCMWPIGEPGKKGFRFCGKQVTRRGEPYCADHKETARNKIKVGVENPHSAAAKHREAEARVRSAERKGLALADSHRAGGTIRQLRRDIENSRR